MLFHQVVHLLLFRSLVFILNNLQLVCSLLHGLALLRAFGLGAVAWVASQVAWMSWGLNWWCKFTLDARWSRRFLNWWIWSSTYWCLALVWLRQYGFLVRKARSLSWIRWVGEYLVLATSSVCTFGTVALQRAVHVHIFVLLLHVAATFHLVASSGCCYAAIIQ